MEVNKFEKKSLVLLTILINIESILRELILKSWLFDQERINMKIMNYDIDLHLHSSSVRLSDHVWFEKHVTL